jgi:hypothetical protein
MSEQARATHLGSANRLVFRFEGGLRPRNPDRGEDRKGGQAPLRAF